MTPGPADGVAAKIKIPEVKELFLTRNCSIRKGFPLVSDTS